MKILIIEDEQNAVERLEKMIKEVAPEKKIIGHCESIRQTLEWFKNNDQPDLVLSDVQLSDGLSFEIFEQLKIKVPVIFITAFDNYALDAFKVQGLHYLLKPLKRHELKEAIDRYDCAKRSVKTIQQPAEIMHGKNYQERFIIHAGAQIKLVHDNMIAYIFTENKMVYLVTRNKEKLIADISLENFEKSLNPRLFYRINRQYIVSLSSIVKMVPASKQRIELTLEPPAAHETITSFERTTQFKKWLLGEL